MKRTLSVLTVAAAAWVPMISMADTIDPASYTDELAVGESVTVRKTVTVEESVSSGVLDVMFLIDTSGSMGGEITAAKTAASDILSGLAGFGDLATGTGYYSEPGSEGVYRDLTTDPTTGQQNIDDISLSLGGNGGDFPEEGIHATKQAAEGASWRPGSSRFVVALGDANFKESDGSTLADAQAALADNNATFIGIDFGSMDSGCCGGIDPTVLADATGGTMASSSDSASEIVDAIVSSVGTSFSEYGEVTVSDLGAGMPGINVSVSCVSADTGACAGDTAVGEFDRSMARAFEFDVTFTGAATGEHAFSTHGLVDGGIVASESDRFLVTEGDDGGSTPVPEPGALSLLGGALIGFGFARRRRRLAA